MKKLYGGMGTFNDIVLHNNGIPLIRENDGLDDLRHYRTGVMPVPCSLYPPELRAVLFRHIHQ
ncbi:DUF6966 domain-containing protein [Enterobacter kobei]|uniref:DUF6966 domain-containing protein n=1 Tax=Enterobacter kobei TaxID=208224 RepID=UPI003C12C514